MTIGRPLTDEEQKVFHDHVREMNERIKSEANRKQQEAAQRKKSLGDCLAGAIREFVWAETRVAKAEVNGHPDLARYRLEASEHETEMRKLLNELNDRLRQLEFQNTRLR